MTNVEHTPDVIKIDGLVIENNIDIIVNGELELHLIHSPDGYIIDCYKPLNPEEDTEEHDYDEDFIDSFTILSGDLER